MKIKILALCFTIIFFTIFLSGCTDINIIEPGPETQNYVVVTVNAEFCVINDTTQTPVEDMPIIVEIVKAGGERFDGVPRTSSDGCTSAHTNFNLYKEQPIVARAYPLYNAELVQTKTLPWEVVESGSMQKAYTWNPYFAFVI